MSFITNLGDWLRRITKSFTSASISGRNITLTRHNGDTVVLTTQDTVNTAFSKINIGSTTITADSETDTLTLVAGSNVSLTPTGSSDTIEISATDTTYNNATQSSDGLLSKEDKTIIDNLDVTYAKITGTLVDNAITRTSPSGHTASFIQHGYTVGDEAEICDIGWDFANRDGAMLGLNSASHSTLAGQFSLVARDATNSSELNGLPNGTLTWNNDTVLTTANGLPLSGGTLTGNLYVNAINIGGATIRTLQDTQVLYLYGGTGWGHGAQSILYGKSHATNPGDFVLHADDGINTYDLLGRPNGTLRWGGKDVAIIQTGAWTPVLAGGTTPGAFVYTGATAGQYIKIGNLVYVHGYIEISAYTTYPTGEVQVKGLPFVAERRSMMFNVRGDGASVNNSIYRLVGASSNGNNSYISLRGNNANSASQGKLSYVTWSPNDTDYYNIAYATGSMNLTIDGFYVAL